MTDQKFDIVSYVENTHLAKLSFCDKSKIIEKLGSKFTEDEQSIYIAQLYAYLNYDPEKDFVILLNNFWKWLGYTRLDHCKTVLLKHFIENMDYKIEKTASEISEAVSKISIKQEIKQNGGQNKECILLTVNCFKLLCLKSRTEQADKIHNYYVRLENIMNELIQEQALELVKQLQIKDKQLVLKDIQKTREIEATLLESFKNKRVFYLFLVLDGNIIKFGISTEINQRIKDHRTQFGKDNVVLKYVFETIYNKEFEDMIKIKLKKHLIEKEYKSNQIELIQLSSDFTYENLISEIEKFRKDFDTNLIPNLIKENEILKAKISELELIIKNSEIIQKNIIINKYTEPVKPPINELKSNQDRIQLYDKNLKLVKTYETIRDACDETKLYKNAVPQSIQRSAKNYTLYKGYRFWKLPRNEKVKEYEIPETFELSKEQSYQRVVQVKDGNIIGIWASTKNATENLYNKIQNELFIPKNHKLKQSTLAQVNKSITNALSIHTNHFAYEHYWYRESDIPEDMKIMYEKYKNNNNLPELEIHKNNKKVYKYDIDGKLTIVYNSISEAYKTEGVSEKTINKYITENTIHSDHYFKFTRS
jgi:hypothetical protein